MTQEISFSGRAIAINEATRYLTHIRKGISFISKRDALEDHQPKTNLFTNIAMNRELIKRDQVTVNTGDYVCYLHCEDICTPMTDSSYPTAEEAIANAAKNWFDLCIECEATIPFKMRMFQVVE